jgi:hypothetical protein
MSDTNYVNPVVNNFETSLSPSLCLRGVLGHFIFASESLWHRLSPKLS